MAKDYLPIGDMPFRPSPQDFTPVETPSGLLFVTDAGRNYYSSVEGMAHQPAVEARMSILRDVEQGRKVTAEDLVFGLGPKERQIYKREVSRLINWDYLGRTK